MCCLKQSGVLAESEILLSGVTICCLCFPQYFARRLESGECAPAIIVRPNISVLTRQITWPALDYRDVGSHDLEVAWSPAKRLMKVVQTFRS